MVKTFEEFSVHTTNKEKEKLNDVISTLLFYLSKRDNSLPVEYSAFDGDEPFVLIPIDVDKTFEGEFYFTISEDCKWEAWRNKRVKLTDIFIHIPLGPKEMTVGFDGLYDSKEEDIYDGEIFPFEDIVEKDELLEFIKP